MKRFLCLWAMLTTYAFSQGQRYDNHVIQASSSAPYGASTPLLTVPGALITVCALPQNGDPCTNTIEVYSDQAMQSPLPNPLTADPLGQFGFYAPAGNYVYSVQKADGTSAGAFPVTLAGNPQSVVDADWLVGDTGQRICLADAELGPNSGTIDVYVPGTIATSCTLLPNHEIHLHVPVSWNAPILFTNNNALICDSTALITTNLPTYNTSTNNVGAFLVNLQSGSNFRVSGCQVTAPATSPVLVGSVAPTQVELTNNSVSGATLFANQGGGENFRFLGNSAYNEHANAAIYDFYAHHIQVVGNHFNTVLHGFQYWGGDSNGGTLAQIATGDITFTGNDGKNIDGSLAWGSMGDTVIISGNTADGCGDICYDLEGSENSRIDGNVAKNCGNNCAAFFFFGKNEAISNNTFTGGHNGVVRVHNPSYDPRLYSQISLTNNDLDCGTVACTWIRAESPGGFTASLNRVHNGYFQAVGFQEAVNYSTNSFSFDAVVPPSSAVIAIVHCLYGGTCSMEGNTVYSSVAQPSDSVAFYALAYDNNDQEVYRIQFNKNLGQHPFPTDINTTNTNPNASIQVIWDIDNNFLGSATIVHNFMSAASEHYLLGRRNLKTDGTYYTSNVNP